MPQAILAALTPPSNVEIKVPQTILASLYTPLSPYGQYPYENNTFQIGASLTQSVRHLCRKEKENERGIMIIKTIKKKKKKLPSLRPPQSALPQPA